MEGDRLLLMAGGLLVMAQRRLTKAEVAERASLASPVACRTEQGQRLPVAVSGPLIAALLPVDGAHIEEGGCFGGPVTGAAGDVERVPENRGGLGKVATAVQVAVKGAGQQGGVAGPAVGGGVPACGHQSGAFGIQPVPRRRGSGQRRNRSGRAGD